MTVGEIPAGLPVCDMPPIIGARSGRRLGDSPAYRTGGSGQSQRRGFGSGVERFDARKTFPLPRTSSGFSPFIGTGRRKRLAEAPALPNPLRDPPALPGRQ